MDNSQLHSPAFRKAALASERLRIISLLCAIGVLTLFSVLRNLLPHAQQNFSDAILYRTLPIVGVFAVYEAILLGVVSRAIRRGSEPPTWLWSINVFIEMLLPTSILLVATFCPYPGPYRALVVPVVVAYFVFIILATLRLSPFLCVLTGVFSAIGYMTIVFLTFHRFPVPPAESGAFAFPIYATYAFFMLVGGVMAGAVARQIRVHVLAALREAEARRQVDQMKHDLDIARSIQQGLLPRHAPKLPGFEIAGWSQPADQTGGDYYDWQELPEGRLVVSLADVTGHGIGPALVTSACRAYARASFLSPEELGRLVDRVHALLAEDLPSSRFVTFVASLLDKSCNYIQLLSAGHGPIFLYSAQQDRVQARSADGLPLGVMPEIVYAPAQKVDFVPGDVLVLITDGFFEWANAQGELFGTDRLSESIRSSHALSASEIIQHIYAEVLRFAGGTEQADDLTVVVIKRL